MTYYYTKMSRLFFRNLMPAFCRLNYTKMASTSALVLVADGSEEMECVIAVDVLRRGGITVTLAGLKSNEPLRCSREVSILPDISIKEAMKVDPFDAIVLPGGLEGSKAFSESSDVGKLLQQHEKSGKIVAAICAAPTALKAHGIGVGKSITCYPGMEKELTDKYKHCDKNVVVDGKLVTSKGPGTAFEFALTLVEELQGKNQADTVKKGLLLA